MTKVEFEPPEDAGQRRGNAGGRPGGPGQVSAEAQLSRDMDVDENPADNTAGAMEPEALDLEKQEKELQKKLDLIKQHERLKALRTVRSPASRDLSSNHELPLRICRNIVSRQFPDGYDPAETNRTLEDKGPPPGV